MARKVRDKELDTRQAREKLRPQGKPYWRSLEKGLHIGYRRLKGRAGTWCVRHYIGAQDYEVEGIGIADDLSDADGLVVFDFWQAQNKARERMADRARVANNAGPYTVNHALDAYLSWLESEGRSAVSIADARGRATTLIRPKLGDQEVDELTTEDLRTWRNSLAKSPACVRTKTGAQRQHRKSPADASEEQIEDAKRARRSSANRVMTILKAALNHAFNDAKAESDAAWRKLKPFRGVDKARVRYLSVAQAQRLANAADPAFRPLIEAALLTGGRYGQLARLQVGDFNRDAGTVRMSSRKGDGAAKPYFVHLTDEGVRFFERACVGRGDARGAIFRRANGAAWKRSEQLRPIAEASERARIKPAVNFHSLRHTYASLSVMAGAPLLVVAQNLGHTDTRMVERHYGHLSPSYKADVIRSKAPRFDFKADGKVAVL